VACEDGGEMTVFQQPRYSVAIDLGTTTLAAALVELPSGEIRARGGSLNPQRVHGLDVVARLAYACRSAESLGELQWLINDGLCRLVDHLCAQAGIASAELEGVAVAGNPTMSHLLLGLPVESLAHPPYRPRETGSRRVMTADLGWPVNVPLYLFPSPGGFVGGDTVAFLLGLGLPGPPASFAGPTLFLDLGTNGEMALLTGERLFATSAAAGPAFEGGNLSCGMAALPGAIDRVFAESGRLAWTTVGGTRPLGLCGSGILDTVALLLGEGVVDPSGRLLASHEVDSPLGGRVETMGGELHFVLYRDASRTVSLSQGDIRQVQLAKGAVRAGMEVLLEKGGIGAADLAEVVLTGSFGASLRLQSLKSIGVLTENMVINARFIREGALAGVIRYLTAPSGGEEVERLAAGLRIIPLSGTPRFEENFLRQIDFPAPEQQIKE
jgi:uncharacterized 2Fe-2S/4Fe-4S cluster protein (DUF4445 family)